MQKTEFIGFRTTPEQRQKLEALATGEGVTLSGVLNLLIEQTPTRSIARTIKGLQFAALTNSKSAGVLKADGAFAGN